MNFLATDRLKLERIEKSFIGIKAVNGKNGYPYVMLSLTDFDPPMMPDLIEDMADLLVKVFDYSSADLIVSEADRGGGPLVHAVAKRLNIPYVLANWYPNGFKGQISLQTSVGFSGEGHIYLNGIKKGQKVVIIDDILSSGGTVDALATGIEDAGAEVLGALFVAEKIGLGGIARIYANHCFPVISLVKFTIKNGVTVEAA